MTAVSISNARQAVGLAVRPADVAVGVIGVRLDAVTRAGQGRRSWARRASSGSRAVAGFHTSGWLEIPRTAALPAHGSAPLHTWDNHGSVRPPGFRASGDRALIWYRNGTSVDELNLVRGTATAYRELRVSDYPAIDMAW